MSEQNRYLRVDSPEVFRYHLTYGPTYSNFWIKRKFIERLRPIETEDDILEVEAELRIAEGNRNIGVIDWKRMG